MAEQEYNQLRPEAKAIVEAYTEGVNAYIQGKSNEELSLEYAVLRLLNSGYTVEPWTPVHSLTWGKAMAWDLGGNMDAEIERAVLLKTLTADQVAELFPEFPSEYPVIVPRIGVNQAAADATDTVDATRSALAENQSEHTKKQAEQIVALLKNIQQNHSLVSDWLGEPGPDIGSNSWVVSGKRTTTGKPLLANDMHLGIQMPSIWFQVALHCMPKTDTCPFNVTGYSFAGVPGVIVGHNDRIAWAFTNLGPDVQDLFIEKVNPDNPNQYEVNGKWVDFETRKETITASGGVSQEITVRITRHGPVVSDTYGPIKPEANAETKVAGFKDRSGIELPEHYVIALSWTALYPNSPFEAVWGFNQAKNWEDFRKAARNWSVPAQNLLYADIDGNIGYQSPGDIPIRKKGDGTLPVPGWTGEYDWAGYLPFEKLPYSYNPQSGYIVTANNQANPRDYPYLITKDYDYGQRAQRIVEMIEEAAGKIDADYYQKMHGDAKNLNAEALVPVLMSVDLSGDLKEIRDELFLSWNYHEDADSKPVSLQEHR